MLCEAIVAMRKLCCVNAAKIKNDGRSSNCQAELVRSTIFGCTDANLVDSRLIAARVH